MELFELAQSQSRLPTFDRVNGWGWWNCALGFVEAFYVAACMSRQLHCRPLLDSWSSSGGDGLPWTAVS